MSLAAAASPLLVAQRRRLQVEIDLALAGIRNPDCSPISDGRAFPRLFSRQKKKKVILVISSLSFSRTNKLTLQQA